jgi:prepilin-type N-terminal cleavage/methylation domain-containing protein
MNTNIEHPTSNVQRPMCFSQRHRGMFFFRAFRVFRGKKLEVAGKPGRIGVLACTSARRGFTLVEIVMAISILSVMMLISFFSFDAIVQSWRAGQEMSNTMGQADYVIDQVVSGLRSAYYPDLGKQDYKYGFSLVSDGDDEAARDSISWVKMGSALVGEECGFAESPHRVSLSVFEGGRNGDDEKGLALKAWRIDLQLEDFKPEEEVTDFILAPRVIGMNCRVLDKTQPKKNDLPNWQDEWKFSNSIPKAVELTLYMEPLKEGEEPLEIKRIIEIPMSELSLNPVSNDKGKQTTTTRDQNTRGGTRGGSGGVGQRPPNSIAPTGPISPQLPRPK